MAEETAESTVTEVEPQETAETVRPSSESDNTTITDRPALESKVKAGLDAVFRPDETDDEDDETADDGKAAQVAANTKEKEEKPAEAAAEETDEEVDQDGEPVEKVEPKKVDAPTLPAAYVRTLKAYGWSDEDIESNLKVIGPKMLEIASKLHSTRVQETSQWAEAGRQARQQQQNPRNENGQFAQRQPQGPQVLKPVDVAALKKQYGDDGLIDAIAGPVNSAIEQINQLVPSLRQSTEQAQRAELETLNRQIEGFFTGKEMATYKDLYGNANETALTSDTIAARNKVLEFADALIVGARAQGRNLSLGEALTLAHDSVSGDFKKTAARKELAGTLRARSKGITIRPTGKRPPVAMGVVTKEALQKKVKAGLAAVFNG